ncbi:MAG: GTPase HflX [Treponema sp.]|nr:GTPase HflX [Treponema sp.]
MVEVKEEEEKKARALLVGGPLPKGERQEEASAPQDARQLSELKGLVTTLGMECAGMLCLTRLEPTPAYGMGSGKAQEIADKAKELGADCIIFDWEMDPTKQRNWEKLTGIPVFDRNEVIIRIFAQRARTKEAVLQVQLAQLSYSLPRLSHSYGNLSRQRGGSFGNKGQGETQLELDRRQVEDKIVQIRKELEAVEESRATQRRQRERTATPACALVGYTNAGKSSLLNALTGADAFVEDKLFATLDPTTRKLSLSEGCSVLLTDTVGFISKLPHTLIDAFKSTLEEASFADLLLVTVDAGDPDCIKQYAQVLKVLAEIGADKIDRIVLLNKADKLDGDEVRTAQLEAAFPGAIRTSAKTGAGFDSLLAAVTERLFGEVRLYRIPMADCRLVELVRKNGRILREEWLDGFVELEARVPGMIDDEGKATTRTKSLLSRYEEA